MSRHQTERTAIRLPEAPTLVVGVTRAVWVTADGEIEEMDRREAASRLRNDAVPFVCHAPAAARRLDVEPFAALDLLELFAFVRPAAFCVPTPRGLAEALDLDPPARLADTASALRRAALRLLTELTTDTAARGARLTAQAMADGGWPWGPAVMDVLGAPRADRARSPLSGLDVWRDLPEWSEHAPPPPPGSVPVSPAEARERLAALLGPASEQRPSQADYASAASAAFLPREAAGEPRFVMAEAGTGVGKTMGYLAPASVWAEKNEAPVWVSTYTRNLQHQIDQELDRLFPDPAVKANRVVVRKGRENYLCLLNMEDAAKGVSVRRRDAIALGLMARWAARSRDGSLTGGDFPAWLVDLLGSGRTVALSDHRGECIYSACDHFKRCYIEKNIRKARRAEIVVANHALVMTQMARGLMEEGGSPTRFVFDEGHHLFDAADSAFSAHFTGHEASELRRWIRGAEGRGRRRGRGLKVRVEDLLGENATAIDALEKIVRAAQALPDAGWHQRCADGRPSGPAESFLAAVRHHTYARTADSRGPYGIEADPNEPAEALLEAAAALEEALHKLEQEIGRLRNALIRRLDEEADDLDTATRIRIESVCRSLQLRAEHVIRAWRDMLSVAGRREAGGVRRLVQRRPHRGPRLRRRHAPPLDRPDRALRRRRGRAGAWGARHLGDAARRHRRRGGRLEGGGGAYRRAAPAVVGAGGRALALRLRPADPRLRRQRRAKGRPRPGCGGLSRAVPCRGRRRARPVHRDQPVARGLRPNRRPAGGGRAAALRPARRPRGPGDAGRHLPRRARFLPARHRCGARRRRRAGRSLRLIVFDRVPWPRPTILHRARRKAFGGRAYDDMLTRLRIKQAFGRLVRRADDRGVFVLLDPMMPSRLAGAFPEGVEVVRQGLADTVAACRDFLARDNDPATEEIKG